MRPDVDCSALVKEISSNYAITDELVAGLRSDGTLGELPSAIVEKLDGEIPGLVQHVRSLVDEALIAKKPVNLRLQEETRRALALLLAVTFLRKGIRSRALIPVLELADMDAASSFIGHLGNHLRRWEFDVHIASEVDPENGVQRFYYLRDGKDPWGERQRAKASLRPPIVEIPSATRGEVFKILRFFYASIPPDGVLWRPIITALLHANAVGKSANYAYCRKVMERERDDDRDISVQLAVNAVKTLSAVIGRGDYPGTERLQILREGDRVQAYLKNAEQLEGESKVELTPDDIRLVSRVFDGIRHFELHGTEERFRTIMEICVYDYLNGKKTRAEDVCRILKFRGQYQNENPQSLYSYVIRLLRDIKCRTEENSKVFGYRFVAERLARYSLEESGDYLRACGDLGIGNLPYPVPIPGGACLDREKAARMLACHAKGAKRRFMVSFREALIDYSLRGVAVTEEMVKGDPRVRKVLEEEGLEHKKIRYFAQVNDFFKAHPEWELSLARHASGSNAYYVTSNEPPDGDHVCLTWEEYCRENVSPYELSPPLMSKKDILSIVRSVQGDRIAIGKRLVQEYADREGVFKNRGNRNCQFPEENNVGDGNDRMSLAEQVDARLARRAKLDRMRERARAKNG